MPIPTCLTFTTGTTTRVHSPRPPESAVERQVNRVTAVSQKRLLGHDLSTIPF